MPDARSSAKLERLQSLADRPDEQAAYATRLVEIERNVELILAALALLGPREDPAIRPALLRRYEDCASNGTRRDPGANIRTAILRVLRPIVQSGDLPLLERAVATYEFLFGEATGDLRAAGLLALNELDPVLAGFHSVRLLTDQYTSIMSGEPATTAVRLLAAQGQLLPLYAYVMRTEDGVADVVAESLRSLTRLPETLVPAVVERYGTSESEIVLLGLFDLLLAHRARKEYVDFVFEFLRTTHLPNIYRSLVYDLVARAEELPRLQELAADETDSLKAQILREALRLR